MMTAALASASRSSLVALGHDGDHPPGRAELGRGDRLVGAVDEQPPARAPHRVPQAGAGQRAQVAQQHDRDGGQRQRGQHQRAPDDRPLDELAGPRALVEVLGERRPLGVGRGAAACRSSTISTSGISCRTQISAPTPRPSSATDSDRPSARLERRTASTECDPEADVGGDEPAARDEREHEAEPRRPSRRSWRAPGSPARPAAAPRPAPTSAPCPRPPSCGPSPGAEQPRSRRGSPDHPVRGDRACRTLDLFHVAHQCSVPDVARRPRGLRRPRVLLLRHIPGLTPLGRDPHRDQHQDAHPAQEDRPGPR